MSLVRKLGERWYPTPDRRLQMRTFDAFLSQYVRPDLRVLDIGAGAGGPNRYSLKGRVAEVVGIDFDPRVMSNPLIDHGILMTDQTFPVPDTHFDLALSISVQEHVEDPSAFAREVARVLKPGGIYVGMAPNRWHYVPIIASLTPTWFHKWYIARVHKRHEDDTFKTRYRLNSRRALRRYFTAAGMEPLAVVTKELHPDYLRWSLPTFLVGVTYERIVNSTEALAPFRLVLLGAFRKQ